MVRECRPPAREPARSRLARRSTTTTSTCANASSPANMSPVGPAPAITTACSSIRDPSAAGFYKLASLRHDPGLTASPRECYILKVPGGGLSGRAQNESTRKQGSQQGETLER
jgi:hypothetical protein